MTIVSSTEQRTNSQRADNWACAYCGSRLYGSYSSPSASCGGARSTRERKPGETLNSLDPVSAIQLTLRMTVYSSPRRAAIDHLLQIRIHQTRSQESDKTVSRTPLLALDSNRPSNF